MTCSSIAASSKSSPSRSRKSECELDRTSGVNKITHTMTSSAPIRIGIVTVSDRASRGVYEDKGGPAIRDCLTEILSCPWEPVARVIPDERPLIESTLIELCDAEMCCLVVTTGGTGPAKRDVTPEATEAVCDKMMPGFGELMRDVSLKF